MSWTEVEEVREDQIVEYVLEEEEEEVEKLPVRPKHARITTEQQEKMLLLQSQVHISTQDDPSSIVCSSPYPIPGHVSSEYCQ